MKKNLLLIIDTHALIHRAFHAFPPLTNASGMQLNAVYGFSMMLLKTISQFDPEYVICASDLPGPTFRKKKVENYKANRAELAQELIDQIDVAKSVAQAMNIPILEKESYEADDIVGTIINKLKDQNIDILVITGDRDLLQLINPHTRIVLPGKSFSDTKIYSDKEFVQRFGFSHEDYVDYKSLVGDVSDNIIGVKGIGDKSATDLIVKYGNVDNILKNLDKEKPRIQNLLKDSKEQLEENKFLAKIECDVPIKIDLEEAKLDDFDYKKVVALFDEFQFKSLIKLIPKPKNPDGTEQSSLFDLGASVKDLKPIYRYSGDELSLFAIGEDITVYNPKLKETFIYKGDFSELLQSKNINKIAADIKALKLRFDMPFEDVQLMQYCFDSRFKSQAESAEAIYNEYKTLAEKLSKDDRQQKLYTNIEKPLEPVLFEMEHRGILVDKKALEKLQKEYEKKIADTKQEIFDVVGHEFNPASTKELGNILFEELQLPKGKKTKTGYSTDDKTLEKIMGAHPVVELIRNFREYTKIKSTYIEGLLKVIADDGRIHTEYSQYVASSGRLSSNNPNLQNLPIRRGSGDIRSIFIPEKGYKLMSFDYSQIELRIMAHMAKEPALIKSFTSGDDIHAATAALFFDKKIEEITKEQRGFAKTLNFGILYGMGEFGMSSRMNIPIKEAKEFIDTYWSKFPKIKKLFDTTAKQAEEKGYVETMYGRRRYFDFSHAPYMVKQGMIREAINMPIQGTQADIIKMAMIKIQKEIGKFDAFMLLQIHDELVFEVKEDQIEKFTEFIMDIMKNIVKLEVPLEVGVGSGDNLAEVK